MLNLNELIFSPNSSLENEGGMLLAFGIDGKIVHLMSTFVSFYELISAGYNVIDAEDPDKFILHFKNGETVVESLECSELMHALLRSEPDIIEVVRQPLPPIDQLGDLRYVENGWRYDENKNIMPPENWVRPIKQELTEDQKQKLRELGHNI